MHSMIQPEKVNIKESLTKNQEQVSLAHPQTPTSGTPYTSSPFPLHLPPLTSNGPYIVHPLSINPLGRRLPSAFFSPCIH